VKTEAASRFCVAHQRYDDYIARDLVAYVDRHYRTLASRAHRGIGGLSMGGYGAVTLALRYPEVFAAAASHSGVVSPLYIGAHPFVAPATYAQSIDTLAALRTPFLSRYEMFWGTDLARWRENDPAQLAAALVRRGAVMPALYLDDGADDPFLEQNRALDWELTRLGVAHDFHVYPGAHNWRYWHAHVGESLAWMAAQIR
jgi:S-formylglutathione hydrolase FrmB